MDQVQEILQAEAVGLLLFNQARLTSNHAPVQADRSETRKRCCRCRTSRTGCQERNELVASHQTSNLPASFHWGVDEGVIGKT